MERPSRFEHHRWVGDKRNQTVHDLDHCDEAAVAELMEARTYTCFGPDTVVEARNRGYRACRCTGAVRARQAERDAALADA